MTILNMDCRAGLALLPDNCVDAVLTDPPYELGFMGHAWDKSGIAYDVAMWRECLRVLKPGGHLLAFGSPRTYHRLACAVEDAGAIIRDSIHWMYASGFPKSRAVDVPGFEGWGTGLKPSHEPICVARKPLAGESVAANVAAYGTGAINIEACRVPIDPQADASQLRTMNVSQHSGADGWGMNTTGPKLGARVLGEEGRWPANVIHDGSKEVRAAFPSAPGQQGRAKTDGSLQGNAVYGELRHVTKLPEPRSDAGGSAARFFKACPWDADDLAAVCFVYQAKASKSEKGRDNTHPTVKPVALGRYLARLICPPGGMLLDPFTGSGSFAVSAIEEGFQFVGFELDPQHAQYATARLSRALLSASERGTASGRLQGQERGQAHSGGPGA